jgi:fatty acid desaturase
MSSMEPRDRHPIGRRAPDGRPLTLWAILVILLVLWALGLVGSIGGGFIHLLLVLAVIVLAVQLLQGRRSV